MPQQAALYGKLTVAENLMLFARLERCAEPSRRTERMLALTDLADRAATRSPRSRAATASA